jgi:hypothetical protein
LAITTVDQFVAAAKQDLVINKTATAVTIGTVPFSLWDVAGTPGAGSLSIGNTASGLVPTDATAGAPTINAFGGGATGYVTGAEIYNSVTSQVLVYDRVFHVGSISLTSLATTTLSSQPSFSSRIPGGTDYTGLELFLEINAAVSNTATTVTVNYYNETGSGGGSRTTGATASLAQYTTRRLVPMPLQAGDKGISQINSVVVGGTVATTGSFNVVIARKIAGARIMVANGGEVQAWDRVPFRQIWDNSCLWLVVNADSTSSGTPKTYLQIANG